MGKIKHLKVKQAGGYSTSIPIGADAANIDVADGTTLEETLGSVIYEGTDESTRVNTGDVHLTQGDVVDNLNSNSAERPLSAHQGQVLAEMIGSSYNFKGDAATVANLPTTDNEVNDTYYVVADKCRYTWTGSEWAKSSSTTEDFINLGGIVVSDDEPTDDSALVWLDSDTTEEVNLLTKEDFDEIYKVSDTQPTSDLNRIWIEEEETEVEVPTVLDFVTYKNEISNTVNTTIDEKIAEVNTSIEENNTEINSNINNINTRIDNLKLTIQNNCLCVIMEE